MHYHASPHWDLDIDIAFVLPHIFLSHACIVPKNELSFSIIVISPGVWNTTTIGSLALVHSWCAESARPQKCQEFQVNKPLDAAFNKMCKFCPPNKDCLAGLVIIVVLNVLSVLSKKKCWSCLICTGSLHSGTVTVYRRSCMNVYCLYTLSFMSILYASIRVGCFNMNLNLYISWYRAILSCSVS